MTTPVQRQEQQRTAWYSEHVPWKDLVGKERQITYLVPVAAVSPHMTPTRTVGAITHADDTWVHIESAHGGNIFAVRRSMILDITEDCERLLGADEIEMLWRSWDKRNGVFTG